MTNDFANKVHEAFSSQKINIEKFPDSIKNFLDESTITFSEFYRRIQRKWKWSDVFMYFRMKKWSLSTKLSALYQTLVQYSPDPI